MILPSIQTLKRNNKKCGTEEVFQLGLESLEGDIDKESFDKILESLIKNQKVKTSCYANKTCLPIPKEDQINNIHSPDKDNLKEDFNNFKHRIRKVNCATVRPRFNVKKSVR